MTQWFLRSDHYVAGCPAVLTLLVCHVGCKTGVPVPESTCFVMCLKWFLSFVNWTLWIPLTGFWLKYILSNFMTFEELSCSLAKSQGPTKPSWRQLWTEVKLSCFPHFVSFVMMQPHLVLVLAFNAGSAIIQTNHDMVLFCSMAALVWIDLQHSILHLHLISLWYQVASGLLSGKRWVEVHPKLLIHESVSFVALWHLGCHLTVRTEFFVFGQETIFPVLMSHIVAVNQTRFC